MCIWISVVCLLIPKDLIGLPWRAATCWYWTLTAEKAYDQYGKLKRKRNNKMPPQKNQCFFGLLQQHYFLMQCKHVCLGHNKMWRENCYVWKDIAAQFQMNLFLWRKLGVFSAFFKAITNFSLYSSSNRLSIWQNRDLIKS